MVLPRGVAEELCSCCLLASEAVAPHYAPLCPTVSATDASLPHGALVETAVSLELWSPTTAKGSYANVALIRDVKPNGDVIPVDNLYHDWIGGVQFR